MAMTMSVALSVTVGALAVAASQELVSVRRDLARSRAEFVLGGAQLQAAHRLEVSAPGARFRWTEVAGIGPVEIIAEAERAKLGYAAAAELGSDRLRELGVADAGAARRLLLSGAEEKKPDLLAAAGVVGRCAPSVVSAFGESPRLAGGAGGAPSPSLGRQTLLGQVWRVRASAGGWADDRIVRFTGDGRRPAATIARRLTRGEPMGEQCDALLNTLSAAD